jgi:pentatricopeptide repeat protein
MKTQMGDSQRAMELYKEMRVLGLRPDILTFNFLLTALCRDLVILPPTVWYSALKPQLSEVNCLKMESRIDHGVV